MSKKFSLIFASVFLLFTTFVLPQSAKADCVPYQVGSGACPTDRQYGCFVALPPSVSCCTVTADCGAGGRLIDLTLKVQSGDYSSARCAAYPDTPTGKWYNPSICEFSQKVSGPATTEIFGERYTFAQVNWVINSLAITLENMVWKSMVSGTSNQTRVSAFSPLATISGVSEVKNFLSRFDLATPVSAQGYGYSTLSGINVIWSASRNTAYLLMVLLLVIAGFLIMFRTKLGGQAVVTIQTMIPKIIITILGITFSYAVAGFLVDLSYAILAFIIYILPDTFISNHASAVKFFTGQNLLNIGIYYLLHTFSFTARLGLSLTSGVTSATGGVDSGAGGVILALLILLCLIYLFIKIFFMLMKTYVIFIFQIIFAPWQILLGLIPGGSDGFTKWFMSVLASVSVFLVTSILFLVGMIFWAGPDDSSNPIIALFLGLGIPITALDTGINSTRSLIGDLPNLPVFGSVLGPLFDLLFGFATLAMIPKAAEMVQTALKSPKFTYGSAIGEAIAGGQAVVGTPGAIRDSFRKRQTASQDNAIRQAKLRELNPYTGTGKSGGAQTQTSDSGGVNEGNA